MASSTSAGGVHCHWQCAPSQAARHRRATGHRSCSSAQVRGAKGFRERNNSGQQYRYTTAEDDRSPQSPENVVEPASLGRASLGGFRCGVGNRSVASIGVGGVIQALIHAILLQILQVFIRCSDIFEVVLPAPLHDPVTNTRLQVRRASFVFAPR